jgi:hypothetical protein
MAISNLLKDSNAIYMFNFKNARQISVTDWTLGKKQNSHIKFYDDHLKHELL